MSGYWSFREPLPYGNQTGTQSTAGRHTLLHTLGVLPTAVEEAEWGREGTQGTAQQMVWLNELDAMSPTDADNETLVGTVTRKAKSVTARSLTVSGEDMEAEDEDGASHAHPTMTSACLADITPSVPESSNISSNSRCDDIDGCHGDSDVEEGAEALANSAHEGVLRSEHSACVKDALFIPKSERSLCSMHAGPLAQDQAASPHVTTEVIDDATSAVQREWWLSRLGVDVTPLSVLAKNGVGKTNEPAKTRPSQRPTPDSEGNNCTEGSIHSVDPTADPEALALVRRMIHCKTQCEDARAKPRQDPSAPSKAQALTQRRQPPRPTVPRAFAFTTSRLAARRAAVREMTSQEHRSDEVSVNLAPGSRSVGRHSALTHEKGKLKAPPPPPHSPAFVMRMEERAAARRAARERRQQQQQLSTSLQAATGGRLLPSEHGAHAEAGMIPARGTTTEPCDRMATVQGTPPLPHQPVTTLLSDTRPPLYESFAELIRIMVAAVTIVAPTNSSAFGRADRAAPYVSLSQLRELRRELVQVASHYDACRCGQVVLRRWRARYARRSEHHARTAQRHAALVAASTQLSIEEAAQRHAEIVVTESRERASVQKLFSTQTAYQLVCARRVSHARFIMRWHFGLWRAHVEKKRTDVRASAYREYLMQCAAGALRELQRETE